MTSSSTRHLQADWDRVKRPIGLKFGAKTPAELAIAIVAELVSLAQAALHDEAQPPGKPNGSSRSSCASRRRKSRGKRNAHIRRLFP
ncbi:MAG: XdhC family protein [Eggerthella lenta]